MYFLFWNHYSTINPICKGVFENIFPKYENFFRFFQKTIDKFQKWCYNSDTENKFRHYQAIFIPKKEKLYRNGFIPERQVYYERLLSEK